MFSLPNFQVCCVRVLPLPNLPTLDFWTLKVKRHKHEYIYVNFNIFITPLGLTNTSFIIGLRRVRKFYIMYIKPSIYNS